MSALAADHRNDIVAILAALIFRIIDGKIKPRGLSLIDLVLHIRNLTGYTAPCHFLQQLT
ncbi:hypothetical protein I4U23_007663 [Adineta vaga]|nr:hypothetical protein I4U23_007663 [Adineta vaga]